MEIPTRRSLELLQIIHDRGKSINTYTLQLKQDELANQLNISRQALNVHLRKLRELDYIRTGRGFIDVTEKGLAALGLSSTPAFILVKVSPLRRSHVYDRIKELAVKRAFRITGDVDALLLVENRKLDEALKRLSAIDGIQETKSYIAIETLR